MELSCRAPRRKEVILLKSNYIRNRSEAKQLAKQAARQQQDELWDKAYAQAAADVAEQITAVHLYILAREFGFGEVRLKRFLEGCNNINSIMMLDSGILGKRISPDDAKRYVEEKYKLDLSIRELKIESEDDLK